MTNHPNRSRKVALELTRAEYDAVMWAVQMQTEGNARDLDEMVLCGMTIHAAKALCRAEEKLVAAVIP